MVGSFLANLTRTSWWPMDDVMMDDADGEAAPSIFETQPSLESAPWCVLLGTGLPLGAVSWWQPKEMVLLRSTCKALRGAQSTAEFLFEVLTSGLGAGENIWAGVTDGRSLYHHCRIIFAERLLVTTLPQVAAKAAGISDSKAGWCAIVAGGFGLHRYIRDVEQVTMDCVGQSDVERFRTREHWVPGDVDIFIPFGESRDADEEALARSKAVRSAVKKAIVHAMETTLFTELELGPSKKQVAKESGAAI